MAESGGFFSNLFGGGGGGGNSGGSSGWGNILGALSTGAQIYGAYNQNEQNQAQLQSTNQLAGQKFEEDKRQFDLNYQLAQAKLAAGGGGGGGGGGSGDALKIAKSRAMQGAYQSMMDAASNGRHGEAQMLAGIAKSLQNVLGNVGR